MADAIYISNQTFKLHAYSKIQYNSNLIIPLVLLEEEVHIVLPYHQSHLQQ